MLGDYQNRRGAPMTMTNASPHSGGTRGRPPRKFTPQAVEKIKELVAQGVSRDEIASLLDVTVGSLQVTCSRLGISLRRLGAHRGSKRPTLDSGGRIIPPLRLVGQTRLPRVNMEPGGKFTITFQLRGVEQVTDVPLSHDAIQRLALEGVSQDVGLLELMAQVLVDAVKKDLIEQILRDNDSPPKT